MSNTDTGVTPSQGFDASTTDSFANPSVPRPRQDSSQLLTLPAPLALNRPAPAGSSSSSVARSNEDVYSDASSNQRLVHSPTSATTEHQIEEYLGAPASSRGSHDLHNVRATGGHGAIRQATSPIAFPQDTSNPFQTGPGDYYGVEPHSTSPSPPGGHTRSRGVSLTDRGPVPSEGVRRVSRPPSRRPTSQTAQQNRYSRSSSVYAPLPPGAALPNPNNGHYGRPEN